MTAKKEKYTFQRRDNSVSSHHCCVPQCTASSRCNSALSFFGFPSRDELKKKWIVNIRREKFTPTSGSKVCSRHFVHADITESSSSHGWRRLKSGAVPVLFHWNNFTLPAPRPGVWERRERPDFPSDDVVEEMEVCPLEHDYCSTPEPGAVDLALGAYDELQGKYTALLKQMDEMTISTKFCLERFAGSDDDIRFYTRFATYAHLMSFWSQIEPASHKIVRVTRTQTIRSTVTTALPPIEEFFLFMTYLSRGYAQKHLAHLFKIHQSTVSRIITTWANFLYTVLGAIGIWLDEETIRQHLPEVFSQYPDTHIILDCTELRCQAPDSPLLQSELHSYYKSHCTFKGMIGIAPHGPVMFVSPLFEGSISDREIVKQSDLVSFLKPTMAIMVDKGFILDDIVPCKVHIPPFLKKKQQLSEAEVKKSQSTARVRAHVERVIRRVKEHKLFKEEIPLTLAGCVNQLFAVACVLVNYENGPLVKTWAK